MLNTYHNTGITTLTLRELCGRNKVHKTFHEISYFSSMKVASVLLYRKYTEYITILKHISTFNTDIEHWCR